MPRPNSDSLKGANVTRLNGFRSIVLPAGFLAALPSQEGDWVASPLWDGRVMLGIEEERLAEHVVETLSQIATGTGRVSDRRYEILAALCTDEEWAQAEMIEANARTIGSLPTAKEE